MQQPCKCNRTERIASVDGIDYLRCLDCHRIFDAEELEAEPVYDEEEQPPHPL